MIATGGSQKDLKTRIGIFRKQPGGQAYDQKVQSDSVLELGENLLLRTVVNEGDGKSKYSVIKLGMHQTFQISEVSSNKMAKHKIKFWNTTHFINGINSTVSVLRRFYIYLI